MSSSEESTTGAKLKLYEHFGVRDYWLVDTLSESVEVYRLSAAGSFELAAELYAEEGDRLETPLLPGLSIALDRVFQ